MKESTQPLKNSDELIRQLKSLNEHLEKMEATKLKTEHSHDIKSEWTQLAEIIDILFGYIFVITTIIVFFYLYKTLLA